jgi:hypothetical protein
MAGCLPSGQWCSQHKPPEERKPCCGVRTDLPYKPVGCPVCNPDFWKRCRDCGAFKDAHKPFPMHPFNP